MSECLLKPVERWLVILSLTVVSASAQFTVEGRPVQVHGFASQGFAYSDANNYLTMDTSKGSFAFTDAGINATSQIFDKFSVGAQLYVRNVGELGRGQPTLDWASGDYRFKDWLGIRAGKIKTVLGLYNDTQDAEFLHTWALLPQSMYPLDLRGSSLAHVGADIYGNVPVGKLGQLAYTAYTGLAASDPTGGNMYVLKSLGFRADSLSGAQTGADLRWSSTSLGLIVGTSILSSPIDIRGSLEQSRATSKFDVPKDNRIIFYGQFSRGNLRVETEYSREIIKLELYNFAGPFGPPYLGSQLDVRAWYAALAYRLSKHLELGTYNARFFPNDNQDTSPEGPVTAPAKHVFDQVLTARVDLNSHFHVKVESHLMNGYGDLLSARGFYPQDNPGQLSARTNLLIVRLGFNF